ncbi:N6-adenosine-specific RNA methylase IME4 [Bradyrhizobium niftali]|uniref:MT-A70 family methyltransferase n=1 Tax=Bradyrhizobium niftali TaxID=2560055 RepID=UPI0038371438
MQLVIPKRPPAPVIEIDDIQRALAVATDPFEIKEIGAKLDAFEQYMHDCGLYSIEDMRPINETRMVARWKLGRALVGVTRAQGERTSERSFTKFLGELGLVKPTAIEAQRIGSLPDEQMAALFEVAKKEQRLLHYSELVKEARPFWYQESRIEKHKSIREGAKRRMVLERPGPFPLIYADPPWSFEIYSEMGAERMPDRHYPTLTDAAIKDYHINGVPMREVAHRDAALLLWCTSSNVHRALEVMTAWDFEFKASAVWVKDRSGLGLIFRNKHELLLCGTRGAMPGPQYLHQSVFEYPRGEHSAKPSEIRTAIEQMYPDFDESTRLELFARVKVDGWTPYGYEA